MNVYFLLYLLSNGIQIVSNYVLSYWTDKSDQEQSLKIKFYFFGSYFSLGVLSCNYKKVCDFKNFFKSGFLIFSVKGTLIFLADYLFVFLYVRASKNLHSQMLSSILKCNMQFFESTPVGRIINRFSFLD